ncbi:MAG: HAD family hydrolase [Thermoplasmata archaeon]
MPTAPAAVTLDLWHTLVYLTPAEEERYMQRQFDVAVKALQEAPARPGVTELPPSGLRAAFQREYSAAIAAAQEGRSISPEVQWSRAAEAAGRVARPERYLTALEEMVQQTPFRAAPEVIPMLDALNRRGYRIAVISNTIGEPGRMLRPMVTRIGLDAFVTAWVFSDELPWAKPAPEIFAHALRALGCSAASAVHVGDGRSDLEGARRAGMAGAILFTGLQEYGPAYRALFGPSDGDALPPRFRAERLLEVVPLVDQILSGDPDRERPATPRPSSVASG